MEVNEYLDNAKDSMELAVEYLDDTLSHIRAGKASARLLDGIRVDYYGSQAQSQMSPIFRCQTQEPLPSLHGKRACSRRLRRLS